MWISRRQQCRWRYLPLLLPLLWGCAPQRYVNTVDPRFGAARYVSDLEYCRNENSTAVVLIFDGAVQQAAGVDEVNAEGCMARHGWEPARPSVAPIPVLVRAPEPTPPPAPAPEVPSERG
jgi:hypothetical protein